MKQRSLSNLALLSIVTLGFYELFWLVQTRDEMVSKFKVKIPSAGYAVLVRALQLIGFIAVVVIVLYAIPHSQRVANNAINNRVQPPAECLAIYNQNVQCRQEIDKYYNVPTDNTPILLLTVLAIIVFMGVLYTIYLRRWVVAYALAVQKVTNNKLSGTAAVLALGGVIPVSGMIYIQKAFNQT